MEEERLSRGQLVRLAIEKPAAGGRMIARAGGQVVLVAGAIPGESVTARIDRTGKGFAYADVVSVDEPSADRRDPAADPLCGGCLYAHIAPARQLAIKSQVIADAFARIGRMTLPSPVSVRASPDEGYRMRARLHVRGGRFGFFREGTHELCDARATRQLLPATSDVLDRLNACLQRLVPDGLREVEVSENVDASNRAVYLDIGPSSGDQALMALADIDGLTGLAAGNAVTGDPYILDAMLIDGQWIRWRRHVRTFFQGNRYLLGDLVTHVVSQVGQGHRMIDLYAGAGLFSIPAAMIRGARVVAVEGESFAVRDLEVNAQQAGGGVEPVHAAVEAFAARTAGEVETLVVDPPRTGVSREALDGIIGMRAERIIYVACDVATLARDARRLVDAGYSVSRADGFDLFPNTPHVETVVVFERSHA